MSPLLRLERQQQIGYIYIYIYIYIYFRYLSFSLIHWVLKKTNTFTGYHGTLENHTQIQTIMVKIYTGFQTKTCCHVVIIV